MHELAFLNWYES